MYYSYTISTLDAYDYQKVEYKNINGQITSMLNKFKQHHYKLFHYWISSKETENTLLSIPIIGKYMFVEKKLNIASWDTNYYKDHYTDFDELFFIKDTDSISELFRDKQLRKNSLKRDIVDIVPVQVEVGDNASIQITTKDRDIIEDVIVKW